MPPDSSTKSNLFSSSRAHSFFASSGWKPFSWNSTELSLMPRMKLGLVRLRISWPISIMRR